MDVLRRIGPGRFQLPFVDTQSGAAQGHHRVDDIAERQARAGGSIGPGARQRARSPRYGPSAARHRPESGCRRISRAASTAAGPAHGQRPAAEVCRNRTGTGRVALHHAHVVHTDPQLGGDHLGDACLVTGPGLVTPVSTVAPPDRSIRTVAVSCPGPAIRPGRRPPGRARTRCPHRTDEPRARQSSGVRVARGSRLLGVPPPARRDSHRHRCAWWRSSTASPRWGSGCAAEPRPGRAPAAGDEVHDPFHQQCRGLLAKAPAPFQGALCVATGTTSTS